MEGILHIVEKVFVSKTTLLIIIFCTNTLDNILLTSVVPIIPEVMMSSDRSEKSVKARNYSIKTDTLSHHMNASLSFTKQLLQESYKALDENSQAGLLLSSKALIQIAANPCVGYLSERYGYIILLAVGTFLLFISSVVYACAGTFSSFLVGRLAHGIASSFSSIAGMSILADLYESDYERSKVMGVAMGGVALGVVVGYPFGGFLYSFCGQSSPFIILCIMIIVDFGVQGCIISKAYWMQVSRKTTTSIVELMKDPLILTTSGIIMLTTMAMSTLEPTIPIWILYTMKAQNWQLGLVFLPDSIGYLIGTNAFGVVARKVGRWICSMFCMILVGFCLICEKTPFNNIEIFIYIANHIDFTIPFSTSVSQLILPHFGIGLGLGIVDAALMPLLALLVDLRHVTSYGSVYAIAQLAVCLAYGLGPMLGGEIVKLLGFPCLMWSLGCLLVVTSPCCLVLRFVKAKEECISLMLDTEDELLTKSSSLKYTKLYTDISAEGS